MFRRSFLQLIVALSSSIVVPVRAAAQSLGSVTCQPIRGGLRVSGTIQGYSLLPSDLLPGRTYNVVQDGAGFRLV